MAPLPKRAWHQGIANQPTATPRGDGDQLPDGQLARPLDGQQRVGDHRVDEYQDEPDAEDLDHGDRGTEALLAVDDGDGEVGEDDTCRRNPGHRARRTGRLTPRSSPGDGRDVVGRTGEPRKGGRLR